MRHNRSCFWDFRFGKHQKYWNSALHPLMPRFIESADAVDAALGMNSFLNQCRNALVMDMNRDGKARLYRFTSWTAFVDYVRTLWRDKPLTFFIVSPLDHRIVVTSSSCDIYPPGTPSALGPPEVMFKITDADDEMNDSLEGELIQ